MSKQNFIIYKILKPVKVDRRKFMQTMATLTVAGAAGLPLDFAKSKKQDLRSKKPEFQSVFLEKPELK